MQSTESAPDTTDPSLTINTRRLADLFLPAYREEQAALDYMNKACYQSYGKPRFKPLHIARMALQFRLEKTVRTITERGGLLLIGGAA